MVLLNITHIGTNRKIVALMVIPQRMEITSLGITIFILTFVQCNV
nr:MAG TPA: hypothetical protein [Caudoviricetes sp.]